MYVIYCITNIVNNKKYVGCTKYSAKLRFKQHYQASLKGSNCLLHKDMRIYGIDNFTYKNLLINVPEDKHQYYECLWISKLNTYNSDLGYNSTVGGNGTVGYIFSDDAKRKMSEAGKNWFVENNKESKKYRDRSQKIKQANSGKPKSYIHRKHLSTSRKDNPLKFSGFNNGFYGKHHTQEVKDFISQNNSKSVKMVDKDTLKVLKVFSSGIEASKWLVENGYSKSLNINSSISQSIKSPFKRTTCGFYWCR